MSVKRTFALFAAFIVMAVTVTTESIGIVAAGASSDTTVYVTKTGDTYHSKDCNSLRKSCVSITLQEAIDDGYKPCKRCYPVALDTVPLTSEAEEEIRLRPTKETPKNSTLTLTTSTMSISRLKSAPTAMRFWSTSLNRVWNRSGLRRKKREDKVLYKIHLGCCRREQRSGCVLYIFFK